MSVLAGRVALVTGGGRGIGRAVALAYAKAGADVVVAARTAHQIETCADEIRALGGRALAVPADIGDELHVQWLVDSTLDTFGRIDVLVNNAATAVGGAGQIWQIPPADWRECFRVNLDGQYLCIRAVLPQMMERRQGKVINVASIAGQVPALTHYFGYSVAKAAVIHMSRVLAEAVKAYRICVNAVGVSAATRLIEDARGILERMGTPLPPVARTGAPPEDNVGLFLFLASSASDHVTGQYIEANSLPSEPST